MGVLVSRQLTEPTVQAVTDPKTKQSVQTAVEQSALVVPRVKVVVVYSLVWHHCLNRTTIFAVRFVGFRSGSINKRLHRVDRPHQTTRNTTWPVLEVVQKIVFKLMHRFNAFLTV